MATCYMLALCRQSSIDEDTKMLSLFMLVDRVMVPELGPGVGVQVEAHLQFILPPEEVGVPLVVRIVWRHQDGTETYGLEMPFQSTAPRMRLRAMGLVLPARTGQYDLFVESALAEDHVWHRSNATWPFEVSIVDPPPSNPSPTP